MVVVPQATHRLLHLLLTLLTLADLLLAVAFGLPGPAETLLEVRRPARRADSGLVLLVALDPVPDGFLDLLQPLLGRLLMAVQRQAGGLVQVSLDVHQVRAVL